MVTTRSIGGYTFQRKEPRERATRHLTETSAPEHGGITSPHSLTLESSLKETSPDEARDKLDSQSFIEIPVGQYTYEDHTADIRIKAEGATLGSCLKALGLGLFNYMTDISLVAERDHRKLSITSSNLESLVFHWLDELLGLYGEEYFMVSRIEFTQVTLSSEELKLEAVCFGERFNREVHTQGTEIKAITMHDFCYEERLDGLTITVLVDI